MDEAHASSAMCGRRQCNHCRILEVVLVDMSKNTPMVWWMGKSGRSVWIWKP